MLTTIYKRICLISPKIEVVLRRFYWHHVKRLKQYRPSNNPSKCKEKGRVDFEKIEDYLRSQGIGEGCLLIVHSSYGALEQTGLDAKQIVERLLKLVGTTGTLAMPAIRRFKGQPKYEEILTTDVSNLVCKYDTRKTMVSSGVLPYTMVKRSDSEVSLHPLNPMVAIGPLAKQMMEHNLDGQYPSPHGPNSSWKFCYDHDAIVIGLGVNLDHYNTISHINEEAFGNWKWSDDEWYRLRQFDVTDDQKTCRRVTVRERKPKWGMLHFAELNANRDRNKTGIIRRSEIGGITVCVENSREYVDYLQSNNKRGKFYYV